MVDVNVRTELPPPPGSDNGTETEQSNGSFYFNGVPKKDTDWKVHNLSPESVKKIKAALVASGYFDKNITDNVARSAWQIIINYGVENGYDPKTGKAKKDWDLSKHLNEAAKYAAFDQLAYSTFGSALQSPPNEAAQKQNAEDYAIALRRFANDNGIFISDTEINKKVSSIINSSETKPATLESVKQWYRVNRVAPKFKQYADEIISGGDLRDLAGDYLQMMAQTLEIDPDTINLAREINRSGSLLNQALVGKKIKDSNGKDVVKTVDYTDFETLLKQDYRWKYTKNANESITTLAGNIQKMFGF